MHKCVLPLLGRSIQLFNGDNNIPWIIHPTTHRAVQKLLMLNVCMCVGVRDGKSVSSADTLFHPPDVLGTVHQVE